MATSTLHSLDEYFLPNVTRTERVLGNGSFGSVEVLDIDGLECAGKSMFQILVDPRNEGAGKMAEKYYQECGLLSSLRHPNIVQFLGICYLDTTHLPVLVMELMERSLESVLVENYQGLSFAKKVSLLRDVARGLVHLHRRSPAVIHRDLTAKNVLVNSALRAKIADVGNARIVEKNCYVTASQTPGTQAYMPPEATNAVKARYFTSLDVFSFGHLSLFTVIQVFPVPTSATYKHPKTGKIMGYDEIERREVFMKMLTDQLTRSHPMVTLITECFQFEPGSRPSASEVLQRLEKMGSRIDDSAHGMSRLELEGCVARQQKHIELLEPLAIKGLEKMEEDLLMELKRRKGALGVRERPQAVDYPYVESQNGLRYSLTHGDIAGNTLSVMIIASVGNQFPPGVQVEQRTKNSSLAEKAFESHGELPTPLATQLSKEAAADLVATATNELQSSNINLECICIDSPPLQRSKSYYLEKIANFFKTSEHPVVGIDYLGHSEKGTGNWCFKDGTISLDEIVHLYKEHCPGKLLTIQCDCCYSGKWVAECAKTLDSLGILPCGHRARERNVLLRVFASCLAEQKAAEPGHSMEAMKVGEDGIAKVQAMSLQDQQSTWFSGTKLVCCRGPDKPCPKTTFKGLKWMDSILQGRLPIVSFTRREQDRDVWRFLMLKDASPKTAKEFANVKHSVSKFSNWGYVLAEGEGKEVPHDEQERVKEWTTIAI